MNIISSITSGLKTFGTNVVNAAKAFGKFLVSLGRGTPRVQQQQQVGVNDLANRPINSRVATKPAQPKLSKEPGMMKLHNTLDQEFEGFSDKLASNRAGTLGSIFRSNTPGIRSMTKMVAGSMKEYAQEMLSGFNELTRAAGQIELDPNREHEEPITTSQDKVKALYSNLMERMIGGTECKQERIDSVPQETCDICRTIYDRIMEETGGDKTAARNGAMSFMFLRVLSPALAQPHTDGGIGSFAPDEGCRNTNLAVSTLLQAQVNHKGFEGGKYAAFNQVIEQHAEAFDNFLDGIIEKGTTQDRNSLRNQTASRVKEMIQHDMEGYSESKAGALFRGNNETTRLIKDFMLIESSDYLHDTLDLFCEDMEDCGKMDMESPGFHSKINMLYTSLMVDLIGGSQVENSKVNAVPQKVCDMCKLIHEEVKRNGADDQTAKAVAMNFFMLRVVSPTIFSPYKDNGIGTFAKSNDAQKVFTTVSSILQAQANETAFRSENMKPFNLLLSDHGALFSTFMDRVLDRGDSSSFNV
jgi:hypothetical protein